MLRLGRYLFLIGGCFSLYLLASLFLDSRFPHEMTLSQSAYDAATHKATYQGIDPKGQLASINIQIDSDPLRSGQGDRLVVSENGERTEYPVVGDETVVLGEKTFVIEGARKWSGILPDPEGEPLISVALRENEGNWLENLILSDRSVASIGLLDVQFRPLPAEGDLGEVLEELNSAYGEPSRWGVLDGNDVTWFDKMRAGSGVEASNGSDYTLLEYRAPGPDRPASILVEISGEGESKRVQLDAGMKHDTIRFEAQDSTRISLALIGGYDDTLIGLLSRPEVTSTLLTILPGRVTVVGDTGYQLRIDTVSDSGVPVPAEQSTFFEVALSDGDQLIRVRQGEAVRVGDALLTYELDASSIAQRYQITAWLPMSTQSVLEDQDVLVLIAPKGTYTAELSPIRSGGDLLLKYTPDSNPWLLALSMALLVLGAILHLLHRRNLSSGTPNPYNSEPVQESQSPMTESDPKTPIKTDDAPVSDEETSGDAHLDAILAEGILKGQKNLPLSQTLMAAFMIFAVGWVMHTTLLKTPFLVEEIEAIVEAPNLHRVATVSRGWNETIGPIAAISIALDYSIGDGSPVMLRVSQMIIHLLNAVFVFLLCRRLIGKQDSEAVAIVAGLLFALNPVAAHTVSLATNRDMVFAMFFMLSSLLLFQSATENERIGYTRYVLSMIAFPLAWLCGQWTWITPVLMIFLISTEYGVGALKSRFKVIGPFLLLALVLIFYPDPTVESWFRFTGGRDALSYIVLAELSWLLPSAAEWTYHPDVDGGAPLLVALCFGLFASAFEKSKSRRLRCLSLSILWPFLILVAVAPLPEFSGFSNVYLYPIGIGMGLLWVVIISAIPQGKPRTSVGILVAAILMFYAWTTNERNAERKDEMFYWSRANEACETCTEPKLRLATLYQRAGDALILEDSDSAPQATPNREAENNYTWSAGFYEELRQLDPDMSGRMDDYARAKHGTGDVDAALLLMEQAIEQSPYDVQAIRDLALWYVASFGEIREPSRLVAALDYIDALEAQGQVDDADRLAAGFAFARLGLPKDAMERLRAIQSPDVRRDAQNLMRQLQPRLSAAQEYQKEFDEAAKAEKPLEDLLRQRIPQLAAEGRTLTALYFSEELLRITQNSDGDDWLLLASMYASTGEWETLRSLWPPPSSLDRPWYTMAKRMASQQNWQGALDAMRAGLTGTVEDTRPDAMLSLGAIALELGNVPQAVGSFQQVAREYPTRKESYLALVDIAIAQKETANVAELLQRAEANGATQVEVESRRSKANQIAPATPEELRPSIIQ